VVCPREGDHVVHLGLRGAPAVHGGLREAGSLGDLGLGRAAALLSYVRPPAHAPDLMRPRMNVSARLGLLGRKESKKTMSSERACVYASASENHACGRPAQTTHRKEDHARHAPAAA